MCLPKSDVAVYFGLLPLRDLQSGGQYKLSLPFPVWILVARSGERTSFKNLTNPSLWISFFQRYEHGYHFLLSFVRFLGI